MSVIWDACTIDLTNSTVEPWVLFNPQVGPGNWAAFPPNEIGPNGEASFGVQSASGNASSGCGGDVLFGLQDGSAVLELNFFTSYYYGPLDKSHYQPTLSGAHADKYVISQNDVVTQSSNGGAGKRVTWTLTISPAPPTE